MPFQYREDFVFVVPECLNSYAREFGLCSDKFTKDRYLIIESKAAILSVYRVPSAASNSYAREFGLCITNVYERRSLSKRKAAVFSYFYRVHALSAELNRK